MNIDALLGPPSPARVPTGSDPLLRESIVAAQRRLEERRKQLQQEEFAQLRATANAAQQARHREQRLTDLKRSQAARRVQRAVRGPRMAPVELKSARPAASPVMTTPPRLEPAGRAAPLRHARMAPRHEAVLQAAQCGWRVRRALAGRPGQAMAAQLRDVAAALRDARQGGPNGAPPSPTSLSWTTGLRTQMRKHSTDLSRMCTQPLRLARPVAQAQKPAVPAAAAAVPQPDKAPVVSTTAYLRRRAPATKREAGAGEAPARSRPPPVRQVSLEPELGAQADVAAPSQRQAGAATARGAAEEPRAFLKRRSYNLQPKRVDWSSVPSKLHEKPSRLATGTRAAAPATATQQRAPPKAAPVAAQQQQQQRAPRPRATPLSTRVPRPMTMVAAAVVVPPPPPSSSAETSVIGRPKSARAVAEGGGARQPGRQALASRLPPNVDRTAGPQQGGKAAAAARASASANVRTACGASGTTTATTKTTRDAGAKTARAGTSQGAAEREDVRKLVRDAERHAQDAGSARRGGGGIVAPMAQPQPQQQQRVDTSHRRDARHPHVDDAAAMGSARPMMAWVDDEEMALRPRMAWEEEEQEEEEEEDAAMMDDDAVHHGMHGMGMHGMGSAMHLHAIDEASDDATGEVAEQMVAAMSSSRWPSGATQAGRAAAMELGLDEIDEIDEEEEADRETRAAVAYAENSGDDDDDEYDDDDDSGGGGWGAAWARTSGVLGISPDRASPAASAADAQAATALLMQEEEGAPFAATAMAFEGEDARSADDASVQVVSIDLFDLASEADAVCLADAVTLSPVIEAEEEQEEQEAEEAEEAEEEGDGALMTLARRLSAAREVKAHTEVQMAWNDAEAEAEAEAAAEAERAEEAAAWAEAAAAADAEAAAWAEAAAAEEERRAEETRTRQQAALVADLIATEATAEAIAGAAFEAAAEVAEARRAEAEQEAEEQEAGPTAAAREEAALEAMRRAVEEGNDADALEAALAGLAQLGLGGSGEAEAATELLRALRIAEAAQAERKERVARKAEREREREARMRAQVVAERRAAREMREAAARAEAMSAATALEEDGAGGERRTGAVEAPAAGEEENEEGEGARRDGGASHAPLRGNWRSTAQLQRLWGQQLALHAAEEAEAQRRGSRPASPGSLAAVVESERYEEQLRRLTELQRRVCEAHNDPSLGGAGGLAGLPTALQDVGARLQRATDTSAR